MRLYYSISDRYPLYRSDLVELFAVELSELGLQTVWYAHRAPGQIDSPKIGRIIGQKINLPPQSSTAAGARFYYWLFDIICLAKLIRSPVDAIQCRDKYIASLMAILVSRVLKVPFFYWASYPFPEHRISVANRSHGLKRLMNGSIGKIQRFLLYRVICSKAAHIFVQSNQMKADMSSLGVEEKKMTAVPMGIGRRFEKWISIPKNFSVRDGRIVYLGTLAAIRQLDIVLHAFARIQSAIPTAELLVIGDGDDPSEIAALKDLALHLDLSAKVRFTGFLPMEEAWALTATAAICLSPFAPDPVLQSASPTKLIEYLALGRPVVATLQPEQSEIIEQSGAGLCVAWEPQAIADAVIQLLKDKGKAEEMASLGPDWVALNRNYKVIAEQVWRQYQSLVTPHA